MTAAAEPATEGTAIASTLTYHKTTSGGQRVYRNPDAAIRDVYVPKATAEQLGNPSQIKLTIHAA